jgi:hypothetical protein
MTDHTTIRITETSRDALDDLKAPGQSYAGVIAELLEDRETVPNVDDTEPLTTDDVVYIARAVADELQSRHR